METQVVWIRQGHSGFHFGLRGIGAEQSAVAPPSDMLFSALLARLAQRSPVAVAELIALFPTGPQEQRVPPFRLTSAFPYAGGVRFYPAPRLTAPDPETGRQWKRLAYVSEGAWRGYLHGGSLAGKDYRLAQQGKLLLTAGEQAHLPPAWQTLSATALDRIALWQVERRARVTVDRLRQAGNIFFSGRTIYAPACGLWFGLQWLRPEAPVGGRRIDWWVELLLRDLGDAGLGDLRSAGFGGCKIEMDQKCIHLPDPAPGGMWVGLSRYHPPPAEVEAMLHCQASYELVSVGGWVETLGQGRAPGTGDQRRRSLRLLGEGAVLGPVAGGITGMLVDVTPNYPDGERVLTHPVWRSGLAFPVGMSGDGG
ncbi:MAG: hypothetical protein EXR62_17620 [Chloroflexi bacterium]|nr:hypothetical protein [Chloroflexota bacterium]